MVILRESQNHISPFARLPRVWMGAISPRDEKMWDKEQAEHPQFAELVRLLIEKGEERGWHRPKALDA